MPFISIWLERQNSKSSQIASNLYTSSITQSQEHTTNRATDPRHTRFRLCGQISEGSGKHHGLWITTPDEKTQRCLHGNVCERVGGRSTSVCLRRQRTSLKNDHQYLRVRLCNFRPLDFGSKINLALNFVYGLRNPCLSSKQK